MRKTEKRKYICERCGKENEWTAALNDVHGFESLCTFCRTSEEHSIWSKRRKDLLIQQGELKDRWEIIHGVHINPVNRGIWDLYHNREDDLAFEKFYGNKTELREHCKNISNETR